MIEFVQLSLKVVVFEKFTASNISYLSNYLSSTTYYYFEVSTHNYITNQVYNIIYNLNYINYTYITAGSIINYFIILNIY